MRTLRWAVLLMAAETAGTVALLGVLLYADVAGNASSARGAAMVTVLAALLAATFGLLTAALRRRRRWARGPAIVLQLLMLPIGYSMATSGLAWLGLPVMVFGLSGAAALMAPATAEALATAEASRGAPGGGA